MTSLDQLSCQRALEALRNGVPNGDAVRALGCAQPGILERFEVQLEELEKGDAGSGLKGTLVSGDFGSGKSHLVEHLEQIAVSRGFVCSRVVISKETPLYDAGKVFAAAVREARLPRGRGPVIHELALLVDYQSNQADSFVSWAAEAPGLIAATVRLHERSRDEELLQRIVDFWSGERIGVAEVRAGLKQIGSQAEFNVKAIAQRDLAPLRFEFAVRLARAAGHAGWVLLLDEVELVGRYSLQQRARSYAALASWLGYLEGGAMPGLTTVATITDDFDIKVLQEKKDSVLIGERVRAKGDDLLASQADIGMRVIERDKMPLVLPTDITLRATFDRLKQVYATAYDWEPLDLPSDATSTRRPIRSYIRRWINEWDLLRLYPGISLDTEEETIRTVYTEDESLEQPAEDPEGAPQTS